MHPLAEALPVAVVIEDDRDLADMYRMTLKQAGLDAQVQRSGGDALAWLKDNTPDLVMLDLNLPEVSGIQLIQYMRGDARLAGVKVIVVTANPEMADTIRNMADLVLIKPTSLSQIRDLARRLVTRS